MARPRVPMEKRIVEGTDRASTRKRAEGTIKVPIKTITECPGLSAEARKHWPIFVKMFAALPVVAESDIAAVQQLVEAYAEVREHRLTLEKEGRFYKSATKEGEIIRAHPAIGALSDADKRLRMYLTQFGMTPSARSTIKGDQDGNTPQDPLQDFL